MLSNRMPHHQHHLHYLVIMISSDSKLMYSIVDRWVELIPLLVLVKKNCIFIVLFVFYELIIGPSLWQQQTQQNRPQAAPTPQPVAEVKVQTFNANLLPAPPLPPELIVSEQDKQTQLVYEQWLNHQNNVLTQQLKYYEIEVQKLRKIRKVNMIFLFNIIYFL